QARGVSVERVDFDTLYAGKPGNQLGNPLQRLEQNIKHHRAEIRRQNVLPDGTAFDELPGQKTIKGRQLERLSLIIKNQWPASAKADVGPDTRTAPHPYGHCRLLYCQMEAGRQRLHALGRQQNIDGNIKAVKKLPAFIIGQLE